MQQLQQFVKARGKKTTFHSSKLIFQAGEVPTHFYLLEEGYVKIFQEAENGQAITLSFFKRGDFFGLAELFANYSVHECSATTLNGATFYAISMAQLQQQLTVDPALWQLISQLLAEKIILKHQHILSLTNLSVAERLTQFLQQFALSKTNGELVVDIPLTHEEISYYTNCSRQKVTSYLNEWRKKGFISYERGNIQIRQPDALWRC